jgi:hypothetical protein
MASTIYNLVKNWLKENKQPPKFPLACIYDLTNMFSTLQYFASDKILMRMREITSLLEITRDTHDLDWSKCSFPSKFVHKKTKDPLFFTIPLFPRGETTYLSRTDVVDISFSLNKIADILQEAGCKYIVYDVPNIDVKQVDSSIIPPILNSNYLILVLDCTKNDYHELATEIEEIISYVEILNKIANAKLSVNAVILNNFNEKAKSENWVQNLEVNYNVSVIGEIREDSKFTTVSGQYGIATEESHIKEMKSAVDFEKITTGLEEIFQSKETFRYILQKQWDEFEDRIYSII